jgi:hypothetical protein
MVVTGPSVLLQTAGFWTSGIALLRGCRGTGRC